MSAGLGAAVLCSGVLCDWRGLDLGLHRLQGTPLVEKLGSEIERLQSRHLPARAPKLQRERAPLGLCQRDGLAVVSGIKLLEPLDVAREGLHEIKPVVAHRLAPRIRRERDECLSVTNMPNRLAMAPPYTSEEDSPNLLMIKELFAGTSRTRTAICLALASRRKLDLRDPAASYGAAMPINHKLPPGVIRLMGRVTAATFLALLLLYYLVT